MKADAASGFQSKISTDTDSQSQSSREVEMSGCLRHSGMQKHELFFLLLLISTLLYLNREKWLVDYSKVLFPPGLVTIYALYVL